MNWIYILFLVIFFAIVIIHGVTDFLDKLPNNPLGAFFIIVAAIPMWIMLKTIFMRPPDEEINRDWNFYAAFLTIVIFIILAFVVFFIVCALLE